MAYTKNDFMQAAQTALLAYPELATRWNAGDPLIRARIEANATMLAMLSEQVDLEAGEAFLKVRDATVLADCAVKGVLPLGKSAKHQVIVKNTGSVAITLVAGRVVLDPQGRQYTLDASVTVPAMSGTIPGSATAQITQKTVRTIIHNVTLGAPFYAIQVPPNSINTRHIVGIDVSNQLGQFAYRPGYSNVIVGERSYHVETDEYRRVFLRFGFNDAVGNGAIGYQPANGDVFTITVTECEGLIELDVGAKYNLENVVNNNEAKLELELDVVNSQGANPPSMEVLRMLARYPSLYDDNAVFLGNFDFIVRRALGGVPVTFLSVWNEQVEEEARGPSLFNINRLFVSFIVPSQTTVFTQNQISSVVNKADDSLRPVSFVAHRDVQVPVTIDATVSVIHDPGAVQAQIQSLVLAKYGSGSVAASRGRSPLFRITDITDTLKNNVAALQDQISDLNISIGAVPSPLPEDFRYVSASSLTINVNVLTDSTGLWSF